jgi:type II secretory pathway predicted ATPase ExeA
MQSTFFDNKLEILAKYLSPEAPIRSFEFLKGRAKELDNLEQELRFFKAIPFIFGNRGVGKTSLARTAAQKVTHADREHIYVACAPGARMLSIFKEIAHDLLSLAVRLTDTKEITKKIEVNLSMNPGIRLSIESKTPQLRNFEDANAAVRTLRDIDSLLPNARGTVVIIDELEELREEDRRDLAFLIKQAGDQDFGIRLVLVGIAENVQQLIGAHESVTRYIKEISLNPLGLQILIDIVEDAASNVDLIIDDNILTRIAIIGNGYPHFAHLMGKTILTEAVNAGSHTVTQDIYRAGITKAVNQSIQQLKISYDRAIQKRDDIYKHLVWSLANSDFVDLRIDDWTREYNALAKKELWPEVEELRAKNAISRLSQREYGRIVTNTPISYGSQDRRNRYKRFESNLMRGHVRLQAEAAGVTLGRNPML